MAPDKNVCNSVSVISQHGKFCLYKLRITERFVQLNVGGTATWVTVYSDDNERILHVPDLRHVDHLCGKA